MGFQYRKNKFCFRLLLAGITFIFSFTASAYSPSQVYLTRHAEKQAGADPELTPVGLVRADNIADFLASKKIKKIYSTDFNRTKQTAKPLALRLNLPIDIYDPREPEKLIEDVLAQTGNVLIVGHSNTTPALVGLLGGKAYGDIDDSEYDRLYQLDFQTDDDKTKVTTQLHHSLPKPHQNKAQKIQFNRNKFSAGIQTYQMLFKGKAVGRAEHEFSLKDNVIKVKETTIIKDFKINTSIDLTVHADSFAPIAMKMTGHMEEPVEINLAWENNHVKGYSKMARAAYKTQGVIDIDRVLPNNTLERSSILLLAHLITLKPSEPYAIQWYNAYDNELRHIEFSYQGEEVVDLPAGKFKTRKILMQGGAPSQLFYISQEAKPKVIKIEIIASPWSYELTE